MSVIACDEIASSSSLVAADLPAPPYPSIEAILKFKNKSAQSEIKEFEQRHIGKHLRYELTCSEVRNLHTAKVFLSDELLGEGKCMSRKGAKERAALAGVERLYADDPEDFPRLVYYRVWLDYLTKNGLLPEYRTVFSASKDKNERGATLVIASMYIKGMLIAQGSGETANPAKEEAAKNAALRIDAALREEHRD